MVLIQRISYYEHVAGHFHYVQYGIVHFALARGKFAVYRYRARKIGSVIRVFRPEIHQDHVAIFAFALVVYVVQNAGIFAGSDDRTVSWSAGTVAEEFVVK